VVRNTGQRLPGGQRDQDKSYDNQRATAQQYVAQMISGMAGAHSLLVPFGNNGLFVRVCHGRRFWRIGDDRILMRVTRGPLPFLLTTRRPLPSRMSE
jgi:hypothetical protein